MKTNQLVRLFVGILTFSQAAATPLKRAEAPHTDSVHSQPSRLDHNGSSRPEPNSFETIQQTSKPLSPILDEQVAKTPPQRSSHRQRATGVSRKTIFVASMAFVTGCVDTVCYRRYKCFVNMMTGNVIKFSTALAESRWEDAVFHSSLILSYVTGVGMFRALDIKIRHGSKDKESPGQLLTMVAPLILVLFMLADVVSHYISNPRLHAPLLSIGFGIMNAASADATGGTILYAVTGHINRMGKTIVDYWMLSKLKCFKSFKSHLRIVCSFAAGIALSVKAAQLMAFTSVQPPMATTAGIMFAALFFWFGYPASTPR